jgi:DDE_Tnp_1-associated
VPAELSSPIPSALTQLADAVPLQVAEARHLLAYLATVPDPRAERGRRHPLVAILAMAAAAVLTGARSMTAIAEWAADAPQPVREALGARRDAPAHWVVPCEATIRRTLARLDPEALAGVIGAWLADRDHPDQRRRAVAVDGKTGWRCCPTSRPRRWPLTAGRCACDMRSHVVSGCVGGGSM